ncbi:hypothetical protein [Ancylomarina longa]|uniref:Uncharacterized protein n=1 Tax=Ancylomarina longa TaxID=2487017 RepID=A0A434AUK3_9BACT|nr:hypothetical protein [Ancylomarina longa]RUT78114.1 hypothetical protein DLK05_09715 [Ancylomarina longa]
MNLPDKDEEAFISHYVGNNLICIHFQNQLREILGFEFSKKDRDAPVKVQKAKDLLNSFEIADIIAHLTNLLLAIKEE